MGIRHIIKKQVNICPNCGDWKTDIARTCIRCRFIVFPSERSIRSQKRIDIEKEFPKILTFAELARRFGVSRQYVNGLYQVWKTKQ